MLKVYAGLFFLCFLAFFVNADESSDVGQANRMKFRGSVFMGMVFYPGHHEHIARGHYSGFNTDFRDYTDKGDPSFKHHTPGDPGRTWGSGLFKTNGIESKLFLNYSLIAPFLAFDHFLLKGNTIKFTFKSGVSPVSVSAGTEITITPLPFLVFSSGFMIGGGYNIPIAYGFARNNYSNLIKNKPEGFLKEDTMYGPVLTTWFNALFQFDTAALVGEKYKRFSHVVMQAKVEALHRMVPNLNDDIPYLWENDNGENYNGWYLYFDSMIGYKIPVYEDPVYNKVQSKTFISGKKHNNFSIITGFNAGIDEMNLTRNQDSTMASGGYGSDFVTTYFGPMAFLDLPNGYFAVISAHWQNGKVFTEETVGNAYFMNREYEDWYVYFRKITMVFGWAF